MKIEKLLAIMDNIELIDKIIKSSANLKSKFNSANISKQNKESTHCAKELTLILRQINSVETDLTSSASTKVNTFTTNSKVNILIF